MGFVNILNDLHQEGVTTPLHDGQNDEEVDSNQGGHGAVETAAGLHHTHY